MSPSNVVDLCSDDEIGESNAKDGSKEPVSVLGTSRIKENYKVRTAKRQKSKHQSTRQESEEIRSPNAFSTGHSNSSMLDQGGSPVDEASLSSAPLVCPAPICRQFWKAGNFKMEQGQAFKATNQNGKNHMCIHPMFLHSNATSHKWAFGAIAELLDNAVDEIQNGATFVIIDKISNPRDGSPALVIQDDGGGMDPEAIRHCMSFGYSNKKSKFAIGQYGNGFKTSSMRLGADVIVFSRRLQVRTLTQSVGLLSYTFLRQMGYDRIVVPMVDYHFNSSTGTFGAIRPHGKEHFSSNLSILLQWSPYSTEEALLKQFDDIGHHGTKIVIYNLWLNDYGDMELDFDSDAEDIRISGDPKLFQAGDHMKPICDQHIANMYHYSLRVYSSILYMRLPQCFRIILRGQVVEHHNIANDLKFQEFILYRPQVGGNMEAAVVTSIGFLKEAPRVNIHGFNIYHRNRLILPFWRAPKNTTNNIGRGVVGVLEANYIEPTHNKQDFEKTSLFQKLEDRLRQMTLEYWEFHCELVGYQQAKRTISAASPSQKSLSSRTNNCQEHPIPMSHSSPVTEGSRAASPADGSLLDPLAQQGLTMRRKEHNPPKELEHAKRLTRSTAYATDTPHSRLEQPDNRIENCLQDQETMNLIQENKKLRSQLLESEEREEELNQKVKRLRNELEDVQHEYSKLLAELRSMDTTAKEEKIANR